MLENDSINLEPNGIMAFSLTQGSVAADPPPSNTVNTMYKFHASTNTALLDLRMGESVLWRAVQHDGSISTT